jgi:hypothetical protein
MYNLLKEKRNHFGALDEIQFGKQNVFEEGGVFVLTNAPAFNVGSIAELAQNWLHNHSC